ncbi:hypothetical protein AX15_005736 [Amanita polypyramis BW_CC]|nr:hypothetical protein AX15_005736 [Amanita polypyramis BW_CC]
MFFKCPRRRRKETPWEVVRSYMVDPVPTFNAEGELDIKFTSNTVIGRTYMIDVRTWKGGEDVFNALTFARQQFIQEILRKGYNVLLYERWAFIHQNKSFGQTTCPVGG